MYGSPAPGGVLPAAVAQWQKFLNRVRCRRLDANVFESHIAILSSKFQLPPALVADLLLRPASADSFMLDPRVPQYLDVLLKLRLVDTSSVLRALYRYSTLHNHAPPATATATQNGAEQERAGGAHKAKGESNGDGKTQEKRAALRWGGSYSSDELVFFRLSKNISQGTGIRSSKEAVDVVRIAARWMTLFADVAAAFSRDAFGSMHSLQTKTEVEATRQAFTLLVGAMCENQVVVSAVEKQGAKCEKSFVFSRERVGLADRML